MTATKPKPEMAARDAVLATVVRKWEGEVGDLSDMVRVNVAIVEDALHGNHLEVTGLPDTYYLTSDQIRQVFFCAYQTQKMVDRFRETFYAAIEA